jgi:hypothetical protein
LPIISHYVARAKNRLAAFLGWQSGAKMEGKLLSSRSEFCKNSPNTSHHIGCSGDSGFDKSSGKYIMIVGKPPIH